MYASADTLRRIAELKGVYAAKRIRPEAEAPRAAGEEAEAEAWRGGGAARA